MSSTKQFHKKDTIIGSARSVHLSTGEKLRSCHSFPALRVSYSHTLDLEKLPLKDHQCYIFNSNRKKDFWRSYSVVVI